MPTGALLPVLGLSLAGLLVAAGAAAAVAWSVRHRTGAAWNSWLAAVVLALTGLLPFAWVALFGAGR